MEPQLVDLTTLEHGDLFTVLASEKTYTEGKVAAGRIFRVRELAYPYLFADHNTGPNKWINSPWRLILDQGIDIIRLTPNALFCPKKKQNSKKKKH